MSSIPEGYGRDANKVLASLVPDKHDKETLIRPYQASTVNNRNMKQRIRKQPKQTNKKIPMKTSVQENSKQPLPRSKWFGSSGKLFRSLSQAPIILLVLFALASSARANHIIGVVRDCNCTNLNIQLALFPNEPLVIQFGNVPIAGTYDFVSQQIVAVLPDGISPGTYLLSIFNTQNVLLDSTNVTLSCCQSGMQGPVGPKGDTGATGATGPAGRKGATGATGATGPTGPRGSNGLTGAVGPAGPKGATGATGARGPAGTNGLNGTVGPAGPQGPAGSNGLTGAVGPVGPTGPAGTGGGSSQYGYIYNLSAETVAIEADVTFSSNGILTPGIVHAPGNAGVAFTIPGDYKVTFSISGVEPGQFGLFINGALVAGSIYGSGAGTQQNSGQVIVTIAASDVLTLKNHSSAAAVGLQTLSGGTQGNVNASILLQKLN